VLGDCVVQHGTIHAREHKTTEMARMAFVLVDAKPRAVNGVPLPPASHPYRSLRFRWGIGV
jgi:hypothetical protein